MAVLCQWDPSYSVGDEGIDREHQKLFELADRVFAIANPQEDMERFKATVKELFLYMEYHFRHEEGLMQSIGFADYKTHCAEHKRIIEEATHMLKTCRTTDRLLGRLRHLMLDWVTRHIMQEDAQVGRCRSRSGQSNHPLL